MASAAKLTQPLPDTLPEDFGDWDSGNTSEAQPAGPGTFIPVPSIAAAKPPAKPQHPVAYRVNAPGNAVPVMRPANASPDKMRNPSSVQSAAQREADEVIFQQIRSNRARIGRDEHTGKRRMIYAAVPAGLAVVILAAAGLFHYGKMPALRHTVEAHPMAAGSQSNVASQQQSSSMQLASAQQRPANPAQQTAIPPPTDNKAAVPPQVQQSMIQDQLSAPSKIPHNLRMKASDATMSSINMGGQGNSSAIGNLFNGQSRANVSAATPKTVPVSAGVAGGLLIQRTEPIYPAIAKSAHVSGTVVLKAIISKIGIIENLRVVSGSPMLTQAAADAVRTWRYKPYKLNNDPVEIETTVNVIFSLGG